MEERMHELAILPNPTMIPYPAPESKMGNIPVSDMV